MAGRVGRPNVVDREKILAAATQLLQRDGLAAISLRQLARQLEISPTSLYRYFANKQQLITALGEQALILDTEALPAQLSPEQRLEDLLNQLRQQVLALPGLLAEFNSALPVETMVTTIADLAKPIIDMNTEEGEAVRHAQSLLWMTLGFALFETTSATTAISGQFIDLPEAMHVTAQHLVLKDHDKLWQEVVARNIRGITATK